MSRLISAPFFSAHPVFRRTEYAAAVGRAPGDRVVTAMLAQHLKAGNIRRIAREVFASVPKHADAPSWSVDRFLAIEGARGEIERGRASKGADRDIKLQGRQTLATAILVP